MFRRVLKRSGTLSLSKPYLLLYRQNRSGTRHSTPFEQIPIKLNAKSGQMIRKADSVRILGLILSAKESNHQTLAPVKSKTGNMLRVITRVSNRISSLSENLHYIVLSVFVNLKKSQFRRNGEAMNAIAINWDVTRRTESSAK